MANLPVSRGSLFDEFFRDLASPGYFIRPLHGDPLPPQIKIDVKEDAENFIVHADLPGVSKEDIHVTIDGPVVALQAEIKQYDSSRRDARVLRSERYVGSVARSLQLPADIDESRASAKFDQGVLTLTLPKRSGGSASRRLRID